MRFRKYSVKISAKFRWHFKSVNIPRSTFSSCPCVSETFHPKGRFFKGCKTRLSSDEHYSQVASYYDPVYFQCIHHTFKVHSTRPSLQQTSENPVKASRTTSLPTRLIMAITTGAIIRKNHKFCLSNIVATVRSVHCLRFCFKLDFTFKCPFISLL